MKPNILITWISSWIWKYISENLKDNFNVFWVSRRNPDIKWINYKNLDLSDFNETKKYITNIKENNFEAIIFNAWIWFFDKIENLSDEEIIETINLNLVSNIIFIKNLIPHLSKKTKIIFIWSIAGKKFFMNWSAYQASKFGLRWFVWSLKNEIKQWVFIINPQFVNNTNFHRNYRSEIPWTFRETRVEDIFEVIKNIINWEEKRFEIDL